jgi:DNA polymerase-3 subunit delta
MIITLTGSNELLLRDELRRIVSEFTTTHGDFGLERLNAEETDFARIIESVQSLPFLADKRLVVLTSPLANKELADKIEKLLASVNDQTELVIVEPKFDKRSSLYKLLKKDTDFKELNDLDERGLSAWLIEQAKAQGGSLAASDANYLVQRVGTNQLKLSNELAKLLLYSPTISRATIDLLTEQLPQSTVFALLDAAFAGQTKKVLQLYQEQRRLKVEPQAILAMLGWQLHVLAVVKTAGERSVEAIAKEAKINPFVVRKTQTIAKRISLAELKKHIHTTLILDVRLKTELLDADEALQNLLLSL